MPTVITSKQLSQRLLTTTADNVIYTCPDPATRTYITAIIVCNTSAGALTYSLYINQNGKVSANQFALFKTRALAAAATDQFLFPANSELILSGVNASLIAAPSAINGITVTVFGKEVSET